MVLRRVRSWISFSIPIVLAATVIASSGYAETPPTRAKVEAKTDKPDVESQLRQAVEGSAAQLGALELWQKKLFDEEVVAQYPRFIKDYRVVGDKVEAQVDLDNIKNYLEF